MKTKETSKKSDAKLIPIHVSEPFKGFTTIILLSKEGKKISFNSLPDEYIPEVEKLIGKLNHKFGKRMRKYLQSQMNKRTRIMKGKRYRVVTKNRSLRPRRLGFAQNGDVGTVIDFPEAARLCPHPQTCVATNERTSAFLKLDSGIAVVADKKDLRLCMTRKALPNSIANGLKRWGFEVLKTKALFFPEGTDGRDHVLVKITGQDLTVSSMHGKYGSTPISLPFQEASFVRLKKELLKVKLAKENDENTDLKWLLTKMNWV